MSQPIGSAENPLRVAIVGSGPSGFYAADHLLKQTKAVVKIDLYDRLPTPFGLVRGGVAPDHQKIKSVTKVYDKTAANPNFRFLGNVTLGKDISRDDLAAHYHQIVYAVGAQSDRKMGIPGESLANSHPATEFVGWYNAHPDYRHLSFDLSQETAVIVGNGNVAIDVARILASSHEELAKTDIADYALDALKESRVRTIYIVGRRGPVQAAFTNAEIKELGEMEESDITVPSDEARPDAVSKAWIAANHDAGIEKNIEIVGGYALRDGNAKKKKIVLRFLCSPMEVMGSSKVEGIRLEKNVLTQSADGTIRADGTKQFETIPAGLVFRSIGYKGTSLPGIPFDEKKGIIPNEHGRVRKGEYVVGWIKRGPSGVIGTNKPDALETVNLMLEDVPSGDIDSPTAEPEALLTRLKSNGLRVVSYQDWQKLDAMEQQRGAALGKPRVKFTSVEDMLKALG